MLEPLKHLMAYMAAGLAGEDATINEKPQP